MKFDPTLVVKSPPPIEGSVLGLIVAGSTRLGEIFQLIACCKALKRAHAEVRIELNVERARKQQHTERLQEFLAQRVNPAKRCREAVFPTVAIHISTPEEIRHFSNTIARKVGCAENWSDENPPTPSTRQSTRASNFTRPPERVITFDRLEPSKMQAKVYQTTYAPKGQGLHGRNNWCPVCKEYVAMSHNTAKGKTCEESKTRQAQREVAHVSWLRTQTNPVEIGNGVSATVLARMVAFIDQCDLAIVRLFEQGHSLSSITRELGVSSIRVVQQVKKYLDRLAFVDADEQSANHAPRKPKRHYVRHGVGKTITFVRQRDLDLATDNLRS